MDDIHMNITDGENGSEDTKMEIEETEPKLEPEQQEVLWKQIIKEHKKRGSAGACKPPWPDVSGTKRKPKHWAHFHDTTDPGVIKSLA